MIYMYGPNCNSVDQFCNVEPEINKAESFLTSLYLQNGIPSLLWKVMEKTLRGGKVKVKSLKTV